MAFAAVSFTAAPAVALTVDMAVCEPSSLVGEAHAFGATVTDATGEVGYTWTIAGVDQPSGTAELSYPFETPGHYYVTVKATDESTPDGVTDFCWVTVHYPLTERRPTSSTSIVYDEPRKRVYAVNQDSDSVTSIDAEGLKKVAELPVYRRPEALAIAPDGKLWIIHKDDYAVAIVNLDTFSIEKGFRLPYASQPVGLAMSPTGDAAYVSLMAVGKLLKLDPVSGMVLGEADVGPRPRGIAVSHDGATAYVTRFISADAAGEVIKVDTATMQAAQRIPLALDTMTEESPRAARGVPNYLFSIALNPDGRQAWIPAKKDNIERGPLRDTLSVTHDSIVRPLVASLDLTTNEELYSARIDLDDRSLPVHIEFSPKGDLGIVTLGGSNRIEIRDPSAPADAFCAIPDAGKFPRASVLGLNDRLFVQGWLSRNVLVYDLAPLLGPFVDSSTPLQLADISTVETEKLAMDVLVGKRIFHDSSDIRMADEGYISCGVCHFEGIDDGRVYDFSDRGEGLRNTMALLGRAGTQQGPLNWSGNVDEIQDFEHQIRDLFGGQGFISAEAFSTGTVNEPFGDAKAGLSPELDALAAYVSSLDRVNPSPFRNPDGSMTAEAVAGKAVFEKLGCDFCHGGPNSTDSAVGALHDVGTLTATSGTRAGLPLLGIDTPTLLGVWETPPYLHDGSAATVRDVLTTRNPDDAHGFVSSLTPEQLDQLVAYVLQLDGDQPLRALPFEPPLPQPMGGSGGQTAAAGGGGQMSTGGQGTTGGGPQTSPGGGAQPPATSSCAFRAASASSDAGRSFSSAIAVLGLLGISAMARRRARRSQAAGRGRLVQLAALGALVSGCSAPGPQGPADQDAWSQLPAVVHTDAELAVLGERNVTYERVCSRGHADSVASALCGSGQRPEIRSMTQLLELLGLGEAQTRAFALTGNSTSLVTRSVSALNPRILVFPRVDSDLSPPWAMTAVGFVRGEQFVELASRDVSTGELNFYLLSFEQRCSYEGAGCDLANLLTEEIEHEWTAYSIYDHDDLEPTSFDCLSCHRPGGEGTKRILRMQELSSPWLHWFPQRFVQKTESDRVLGAQFAAAHQYEQQYGGIPVSLIMNALDEGSGAQLEALLRAEGFAEQPNPFDAQIAKETSQGASPTWKSRFESHLRGEAIAVPYPQVDVTDEAKRNAATQSYQNVVQGLAPRESLLDIRDIFSTDAAEKLSFVPTPGADGKTVLLQMCGRCHDGRSNPALAKSRFNVLRLDAMSRDEKDYAITRMNEPLLTRMPPWRTGNLSPESLQAAVLELQK